MPSFFVLLHLLDINNNVSLARDVIMLQFLLVCSWAFTIVPSHDRHDLLSI